MADVTVDILVNSVSYKTWLSSSYISMGMTGKDGQPLIVANELGMDQEDAFTNFMEEAVREVLKVFLSRQGDVAGVPFEYDGINAIYRFNEETPVLPQAAAIKNALYEDTKNALFVYVSMLWFKMKENDKQVEYMLERYNKLTTNINIHLYKLHD